MWSLNLKVGITVFISIMILVILLISATDSPFERRGDFVTVHFNFVNDLKVGAGVMLSGVQIGRVTSIRLLDDASKVEVDLRVDKALQRLRRGSRIEIGIIGFVGEAFVDIENGPDTEPLIETKDFPLTGIDPASVADVIQSGTDMVVEVAGLIESSKALIDDNQHQVKTLITDLSQMVRQISETVVHSQKQLEQTLSVLNQSANDAQHNIQITLDNLNTTIDQVSSALLQVAENTTAITESVDDLIYQNQPAVTNTLNSFQSLAMDLKPLNQRIEETINKLQNEILGLAIMSRESIETELPKIDQAITEITETSKKFGRLGEDLAKLVNHASSGNGTFAQLIHEPDLIEEVKENLGHLGQTLESTAALAQDWQAKSAAFQLPPINWHSEVRYLTLDDQLQSEFLLGWSPGKKQLLQFGFSGHSWNTNTTRLSLQYSYKILPFMRSRIGLNRMSPRIATDFMLFDNRIGFSLLMSSLNSKNFLANSAKSSTLTAELYWKLRLTDSTSFHWLIGLDDFADRNGWKKPQLTLGLRLADSSW